MGLFRRDKMSDKIEKLDEIVLDLQVETTMTGKKIERAETEIKALIKKGIGASPQQKRILAAQAKAKTGSIRALQHKLMRDLAVYSFATMVKGAYEAQEIMDEGPMKALQDVMKVKSLPEMQKVMQGLAKKEQHLSAKLNAMQQRLDYMQEEVGSVELEDNTFVGLMEAGESLPPEQLDSVIKEKVKLGAGEAAPAG
jgi:hypothetical protein